MDDTGGKGCFSSQFSGSRDGKGVVVAWGKGNAWVVPAMTTEGLRTVDMTIGLGMTEVKHLKISPYCRREK